MNFTFLGGPLVKESVLSVIEWIATRQTAAILQIHVACGTHGIAGPILPPILVTFGIELSRSIKSHLVSIVAFLLNVVMKYKTRCILCANVCNTHVHLCT